MILMYNEKTDEVRATVANVTGKVFMGYIEAGFKPICRVRGTFMRFDKFSQDDRDYFSNVLNHEGQ